MTDFSRLLRASGPASEFSNELPLFGQFVGSWDVSNRLLDEHTGQWAESRLTWAFAWILGGRGVQDVLARADGPIAGTTIRIYDPKLGQWRVTWYGVAGGDYCELRARVDNSSESAIFMEGVQTDGRPIRWRFSNITPETFTWEGKVSNDAGQTWWLEQRMTAERIEKPRGTR